MYIMKYDIVIKKNEVDLSMQLQEDVYDLFLSEKSKLLSNMFGMYLF